MHGWGDNERNVMSAVPFRRYSDTPNSELGRDDDKTFDEVWHADRSLS